MVRGYSRHKVRVGWLHYYLVWHTWKCKPLLEQFTGTCEDILKQTAEELNCEIKELEVKNNRVYLAIKTNPLISPNQLVSKLKGATSKTMREKFIQLRKVPSLWERSYFISSYGRTPKKDIREFEKFIDRQTKRWKRKQKKQDDKHKEEHLKWIREQEEQEKRFQRIKRTK